MHQMTSLDALFLSLETENNYGHVGSLAILDPSTAPDAAVTADRLRELVSARAHLLPPFTRKLARVPLDLDWPYWVADESFDVAYHVREIALPAPGTMEQLVAQAGRIYSRRLDRSRPLWELYLIHGLQDGRVALLNKVHHAAVDGLSGGEILGLFYDITPEPRDVDPPADTKPVGPLDRRAMTQQAVRHAPRAAMNATRRVVRLAPHLDAAIAALGVPGSRTISRAFSRARNIAARQLHSPPLERSAVRAPRNTFDAPLSEHRVFGIGSLPLDDVKAVKNHFGVKVNDVVVALVAGAVREHLLEADRLPDRTLVAQVPVSVRTDEERGTFGNQVSMMLPALATDIADPADRLRAVREELLVAKAGHDALPAKALRDAAQLMPAALHALSSRLMFQLAPRVGIQPPYNLIVSNVPGPPIDLYAAGARLEALYPLSIITQGAGLNVTVMSYRDSLDVGITADGRQTPDVQTLVAGMQRELDRLLDAVLGDDTAARRHSLSVGSPA